MSSFPAGSTMMLRASGLLLLFASVSLSASGLRLHAGAPFDTTGRVPGKGRAPSIHLPISFQPNQGQAPSRFQYVAQSSSFALGITRNGFELAGAPRMAPVRVTLLGSQNPRKQAEGRQDGFSNYLLGTDSANWRTGVPNYSRVRYKGVYPGIDFILHGHARSLEYDFVVAPHAHPERIRIRIEGDSPLALSDEGDLLVGDPARPVHMARPIVYQESVSTGRRTVPAVYILDESKREVRFRLAAYDHESPLVIDPTFVYSTYLGGSGDFALNGRVDGDTIADIAVDGSGNLYAVGTSWSFDTPTASPYQAQNKGYPQWSTNTFVAKLSPDGARLIFSTYLGGSASCSTNYGGLGDFGFGIAVDDSTNVYVTGLAYSDDFPVTSGAYQTTPGERCVPNAFVTKIDASGTRLGYSTYLGGSGNPANGGGDAATDIAVDSLGNAYVTGIAYSPDFPRVNAFQNVNKGYAANGANSFVSKLNPLGTGLVYSTYLGGTTSAGFGDMSNAIAVDANVNAIQATNRATSGSSYSAFVSELSPAGNTLLFSTYLGGTGHGFAHDDYGNAIAIDTQGKAYVVGGTASKDFPVTPDAFQDQNLAYAATGSNAFLSKIDSSSSTLLYSTYLGGTSGDYARSVAVDSTGKAYVAGLAGSTDFPTVNQVPGAIKGSIRVGPFVTVFTSSGNTLLYSTILAGADFGSSQPSVAVDTAGNAYVAGQTRAHEFPTVNPFQAQNNAPYAFNGFISKFTPAPSVPPPGPPTNVAAAGQDASVTVNWSPNPQARSYNLYQSETHGNYPDAPTQTGLVGTSTSAIGLQNGVQYFFKVSSVSGDGEGLKSAEVSATPETPPPPSPPPPQGAPDSSGGGAMPNGFLALAWIALWRRSVASRNSARAYRGLRGPRFVG